MATTLARVPSGALGWDGDLFGDDFDDVVAAVFAADGDAPAWLEAPLAPAPASKAAPASLAPRAAAPRAPAPPADGKQTVTPLHRCVNPSHAVPCAWCAPRRSQAPHATGGSKASASVPRASLTQPPARHPQVHAGTFGGGRAGLRAGG
jgi:hypothetical protein